MSFADEEPPTKPDATPAVDQFAILRRMFANLTPEERTRALVVLDAWFNCDANKRALIEATACEFADLFR